MEMKKYLIVADIHGSMIALDRTLELFKQVGADELVVLGDTFGAGASEMVEKFNEIANRLVIVRGNNDWFYEPENAKFIFMNDAYLSVAGKIAYACHGHKLDDMNLEKYHAKIIIQGHLHRPFIETHGDIIRFCPGSIASPRAGSKRSYAIIEGTNLKIITTDDEVTHNISLS